MKTAAVQTSGEQECESTQINEPEMDMPIAKRTRAAQRARWREHSKNVQGKQVHAIERHATGFHYGEHLNY